MNTSSNPTQRFYDRISHAYDLIADGGERKARQRGLELLNAQPGERVLEIGYGTGHSLVALAESVGQTGRVSGIDISPGMRDVAMKRVREAGQESVVDFHVGSVPPIPFDDASFDAVTMSFTLELFAIESIPSVLSECRRVLKPGGRLGIVSMATVQEGEHESVLERTYIWMHIHFPHFVDCQPIPLETLLSDAGFSSQKQERIDLFTMPVAIVVAT